MQEWRMESWQMKLFCGETLWKKANSDDEVHTVLQNIQKALRTTV